MQGVPEVLSNEGRPLSLSGSALYPLRSGLDSQVLLGQMVWHLVLGYLGPVSTS